MEAETNDDEAAVAAVEHRYGAPVSESRDQQVIHPTRDHLIEVVESIRDDGFEMCIDVTAVDYLEHPNRELPDVVQPERFEVVVGFISHKNRARLRLRVQVPEDDPTLPSLFDLYPGTEALEREVYDMFGIVFVGHPDMTRILMPEDWRGHPLRKDYEVGAIPVQFKAAPGPR
ncbi:MAG: NADH-quinone oxidoreductase subunit C [Acidimicrobiales bacterium]